MFSPSESVGHILISFRGIGVAAFLSLPKDVSNRAAIRLSHNAIR
jgi:hypothetical protein